MKTEFNIAICGAGPVGQALALLLVKKGLDPSQLVLLDAKTQDQAREDRRTIALSYGSHQLLSAIGASPLRPTEIHQIHVSRCQHFGRTLIDRAQHGVPALGYLVRYPDIIAPLSEAIGRLGPDFTFLRPAKVTAIQQNDSHAQLMLDDGRKISAQIVVQAEGGLFNDQQPQTRHHDYQQSAIVATLRSSAVVPARAYERFTDQGPLALLPLDDGYSMVWCMRPDQAEALMQQDDASFLLALQDAFGHRVGKFLSISQRSLYRLGLNAQTSAAPGRVASIGNAAQTLHPVAGQGLNLGLRDAVQLARCLAVAATPAALQQFFNDRAADRSATIRVTDSMAQVFTRNDNSGAARQVLLGAALAALDIIPSAQGLLARQMMYGSR